MVFAGFFNGISTESKQNLSRIPGGFKQNSTGISMYISDLSLAFPFAIAYNKR